MATSAAHQNKALHNEQFVRHYDLGSGEFAGWAVTALFYSAVHLFRALIVASDLRDVRDCKGEHRAAERLLRTGVLDTQAWGWYEFLKNSSRNARYEMMPFTPADFEQINRDWFTPFRAFALSRLNP
ncbi:MAG: hypothetical protein ACRD3D_18275 [Terriglobia bacterium]